MKNEPQTPQSEPLSLIYIYIYIYLQPLGLQWIGMESMECNGLDCNGLECTGLEWNGMDWKTGTRYLVPGTWYQDRVEYCVFVFILRSSMTL